MSAPHSSCSMRHSSLQKEFYDQHALIDTQDMFPPCPHDSLRDWRAPSPFTLNFAQMSPTKESKGAEELPLVPSLAPHPSGKTKRPAVAQFLSEDVLRERVSMVPSGSLHSDPGMIEDSQGWSDSDISFDEERNSLPTSDEIWDSFWTTKEPSRRPTHRTETRSLSPSPARNTLGRVTGLRRPGAPPRPAPLQSLSQSKYSAFPQTSGTSHKQESLRQESLRGPHKSWPLPINAPQPKSTRPAHRSRSYTSPTNGSQVLQPSNLSTCITATSDAAANANANSAAGSRVGTTVYSKSAPVTPGSACFSPSLMDLMEKSVFEDDEDEDEDEKTGLVAFASKLHLRSLSAGGKEPEEKTMFRKEKTFRRSAGEALKGVFGKKK